MNNDRVIELLQRVVENTAREPLVMPIPMQRMEKPVEIKPEREYKGSDAPRPKTATAKVLTYLEECKTTGEEPLSRRKAADLLGVSPMTISRVYKKEGIE